MKCILEHSFEELSKVKKFLIFRHIRKIMRKVTISFMLSVYMKQLGILEFLQNYQENSDIIKIWE
jgi:hypothetical protein